MMSNSNGHTLHVNNIYEKYSYENIDMYIKYSYDY